MWPEVPRHFAVALGHERIGPLFVSVDVGAREGPQERRNGAPVGLGQSQILRRAAGQQARIQVRITGLIASR